MAWRVPVTPLVVVQDVAVSRVARSRPTEAAAMDAREAAFFRIFTSISEIKLRHEPIGAGEAQDGDDTGSEASDASRGSHIDDSGMQPAEADSEASDEWAEEDSLEL